MELLQLRYFLEVASTQHVTQSADRLHIAQPALTQSLRRLEDDLGVPLFEHRGRNIVLNEYGTHFYRSIAPLIEQLDRIPEELRCMAKLDSETIRVNVLAASALMTEAIISYKEKHRNINFQLFQNSLSNVSDIAVSTAPRHQTPPEKKDCETVIHEKIFLAVSAQKYNTGDKISLFQLGEEGFISLLGSRQFRAVCDRICHRAGFKPKVIFESDNPAAVQNMIAAGMGVGFWPEFTWGKPSGHVRLMTIQDFVCYRDIILSRNPERKNPNVTDFFCFLKEYFLARQRES